MHNYLCFCSGATTEAIVAPEQQNLRFEDANSSKIENKEKKSHGQIVEICCNYSYVTRMLYN